MSRFLWRHLFVVATIAGCLVGAVLGLALTAAAGTDPPASWSCSTTATDIHCTLNTTTTEPASTTSTTTPPSTIVPAGPACPTSTATSTYLGRELTTAQAIDATVAGGAPDLATVRIIVGIGRAESSLCVSVVHFHSNGSTDRGWLQINSTFWPAYPAAQVFDPVGAVRAALDIHRITGTWSTWNTYPTPAVGLEPSAATVCAVSPVSGC